jgi:hypothetical protein
MGASLTIVSIPVNANMAGGISFVVGCVLAVNYIFSS